MVQNNAERCAKYRAENSEKFKLIAAIQQFKRSKELASESLDAEKMRRAAALRKRMQRERENERDMEKSTGRIVTRGTESKNVNEGDNAQCILHSALHSAEYSLELLIYHSCIATSAKMTVGKLYPAKLARRKKCVSVTLPCSRAFC